MNMLKNKKLIIANWKMNPETLKEARGLFLGIKKHAGTKRKVQTIVCPPNIFLSSLSSLCVGNKVSLGGQNIFWKNKGSFTGEIGPSQLKSIGANYVILGHSERRSMGETDEMINRKLKISQKEKLIPILCIGEHDRDSHGEYLHFLRNQITLAFEKIKSKDIQNIIVAYEPIWAIGKVGDDAINSEKLHETILFIRRVISDLFNKNIAMKVVIIYGGSVEPNNAEELLKNGGVSGFLVGHASLNKDSFGEIIEIANTVK